MWHYCTCMFHVYVISISKVISGGKQFWVDSSWVAYPFNCTGRCWEMFYLCRQKMQMLVVGARQERGKCPFAKKLILWQVVHNTWWHGCGSALISILNRHSNRIYISRICMSSLTEFPVKRQQTKPDGQAHPHIPFGMMGWHCYLLPPYIMIISSTSSQVLSVRVIRGTAVWGIHCDTGCCHCCILSLYE